MRNIVKRLLSAVLVFALMLATAPAVLAAETEIAVKTDETYTTIPEDIDSETKSTLVNKIKIDIRKVGDEAFQTIEFSGTNTSKSFALGTECEVRVYTTDMSEEEKNDGTIPYLMVGTRKLALKELAVNYYINNKPGRSVLWRSEGSDNFNPGTYTVQGGSRLSRDKTNKISLTWKDAEATTSVEFEADVENVTKGDYNYSTEWEEIQKSTDAGSFLSYKPTATTLFVDSEGNAEIPTWSEENWWDQYGSGLVWELDGYKVSMDDAKAVYQAKDDKSLDIPEGTKKVKVTYCFKVENVEVTNIILPLERRVLQNNAALTAKNMSDVDTYLVTADKENVVVDYTAKMNMENLGSNVYGGASWSMLCNKWDKIGDETTVYLNFTFDEKIDLESADFSKAVLTSDMFTFDGADPSNIKIDAQNVRLTCHWNSELAKKSVEGKETLDPIITLSNVPLKVKNEWGEADTITLTNRGSVSGFVVAPAIISHAAINGGSQSDSFALTTKGFTVTYTDGVEGAEVFADQVYEGLLLGEKTPDFNGTPTRSGYTFEGWEPAVAETVTGNATYVAQWSPIVTTVYYRLKYETNGGTTIPTETWIAGALVKLEKTPSREGYTFTGWYDENGEKVDSVKMYKNRTVYAHWELAHPVLNKDDHVAYIIGYPNSTDVRPEGYITRAEVATIFFRLLTDESRAQYWSQSSRFSDVAAEDWYNNAISTLANAGIIQGDNGEFRPNDSITRAEFAAIASRFDDVTKLLGTTTSFTDVLENHWAVKYIAHAEESGWINGYEDGTFKPDAPITRAEAMKITNRVLERAVKYDEDLHEDMITWSDNTPDKWYYRDVQEATNSHDYHRTGEKVSDGMSRTFEYEKWDKVVEAPDWAALEKTWSTANTPRMLAE